MIPTLDSIPAGKRAHVLHELEVSGATATEAREALDAAARREFERYVARNGNDGATLALSEFGCGQAGSGPHSAWCRAAITVLIDSSPVRPCPPEEQAKISGIRAPTSADHRARLRSALAAYESGKPVAIDRIWPSVVALLLADAEI